MWLHALHKRVRRLFSSRRHQSPSSSPSGQACAAAAAAAAGTSELRDEVPVAVHRADARGDPQDRERRTPLHLSSANGRADVAGHLAGKSCQLNLAEDLERAPLVKAVQHQQEECVAVLLERGAHPNLADANSNAALHLALLSGNTHVAGLLLERDASSDAQNKGGHNPLNVAVSKQHEEMLECLPKKAAGRHTARQCERIAQAFTASHEADVEEDNLHLREELEKLEVELRQMEEKYLNSERCVRDLKTAMDEREREELAAAQELQDQLGAYFENQTAVKQLQEHVQRLEIKAISLEATVQQQSNRIEILQRDLPACASVHNRLEDMIMSLQTAQAAAEDHHKQVQKQNVLALTSKELQSMWEEQFRSRSNLEERVAQLDREKADLFEQCESERKKVKQLMELKRPVELRLDQEMRRNLELQKNLKRLKRLLSRATKKIQVYEEREMESQLNLKGEMKNRYSEMVSEVERLRTKVAELSQQLDMESKKSMQLEVENRDLREELSTLHGNCEKLEKSKCQLKEEVAKLQHRLETNMVDHSQIEQYKREVDERADQEIRQKLHEVNLFLQAQAASQDRLEHIRASHHASLRNQLKDRIRDLECELDKIKNTQQESTFPKECAQAEVEKYKDLYQEEVKTRRCLAKKLERAKERLEEANAKLLWERHKNESFITSSIVSGGLAAAPVLYSTGLGHFGNNLRLDRALNLGGSSLS
ncbi:ankyrin repeat domain-containing protein 26-like [Chamaea fasciata]|uniref:ankyrin repeat domain-containing protein 26-like n=1 Tax=Chamaea fasciata TaxID=190680 RepID=UPI003369CF59